MSDKKISMYSSQTRQTTLLELTINDIHLWLVDYDELKSAESLVDFESLLSADERQKLCSFKSSKRRDQYLITRAALRKVLTFYIANIAPNEIRFAKSSHGKPKLKDSLNPIEFNVSHSQGKALIAVARNRILGADIEFIDTGRDVLKIAEQFFHPKEWDAIQRLKASKSHSDWVRYFYKLWTLKEAFVKADGRGFALPFSSFHFAQCDSNGPQVVVTSNDTQVANQWHFEHFFLASNHSLAIAYERPVDAPVEKMVARKLESLDSFSAIDLP